MCAGVLAFGGVAVAAPKGDPGPPEQAQGNGPPAEAPAPQANGHANQHAQATTPTSHAGTRGSAGGTAQARGTSHTRGTGQATAGGGSSSSAHSHAGAHANVNSQEKSSNGHAGKTTLCHATGSNSNPYVGITISNNGVPAHDRHQNDEDIIPASGDCPGGTAGAGANEHGHSNEHGKVSICHATGSETNPYVLINVSVNALKAHTSHQDGEDIVAPTGECPGAAVPAGVGNPPSGIVSGNTQLAGAPESGAEEAPASGVMGVSEESGNGSAPEGAVLGAQQGGVEGATQVASTSGGSLPFTGLALGLLVALGAALAAAGVMMRRRTAQE